MMRTAFWLHPSVIGLLIVSASLLGAALYFEISSMQFLWILLPIVLAPFYEWAAHKWVLHAPLPAHQGLRYRLAMRLHHRHHMDPGDKEQTFAPVWAIVLVIGKFALLFWLLLGWQQALMPTLAVTLYYTFYEWMHYSHHDPDYKPKTAYGHTLKKAHMHHHFYNHNYWWGVTNDLADRLFATGGRFEGIPRSADTRHIGTQQTSG